ncbi:hypothetical protein HMPREF1980_02296 [Actinomyces sp. oral taxon 172 str. F0311]|nr:hypothetical protein HMPREF1980_02296 [Actinomyces sp. oral taxon 172 str. F0311]
MTRTVRGSGDLIASDPDGLIVEARERCDGDAPGPLHSLSVK